VGLAGVADWISVVPRDSPCPLPVLQAHLAMMRGGMKIADQSRSRLRLNTRTGEDARENKELEPVP
jgi:hypothetical protein